MFERRTLQPGQPIFTADQHRLGFIAEVRGPFLRVRRFLRPGFWLASEYVLWADDHRVVMAFGRRDLSRYQRRNVPETPIPTGSRAPARGPAVSSTTAPTLQGEHR